ncbi:putative RNA-directed DNA polymerase, eukaryota, reverse transcriptase zinc-binding domain protein [Tanacetum coccineum]
MDSIQKAHIKWDVEGDENSKFFHSLVNQKRRTNSINGIMHEGLWVTDPQQIKVTFFNFFKQKFQANDSLIDFPSTPSSSRLDDCNRVFLETNASMDELKAAVWGCGSEKAPGPDGYTFAFVKKYWDMLKVDIFGFVNSFLSSRKMPLALILGSLLSFLSEAIDWYKKRKKKMLIFKVDYAKAFDSVSWRYLDFMLCNLGFRLIWRSWIKACLESSRTSILVNGSPTSDFNVKRGLRQGDPLSSFLFIIIMEGLHMALSDSVRNGFIRGINISSSGINLSHLFFADDVIITTDWSTHDLENVIRIFKVFYLSSGLKINIHKSSIYGVAVSHEEVQLMASNTGCNAGFFPFSYLGLPIGSNMSLTANWKFLVDKFHSKLSSWNANLLSYGGRLTLLKEWPHVLASFDKGRLAISSLKAFNLALLHKWRWRFFVNPDSLWVKVIQALHGSEGGFDQNGYISRLFRLEREKDCLIRDRISNGQWKWDWSRSILRARNSTHLNHMLADISQIKVREGPDKCIWSTAHDGMFSVGALRRLIDDHMLPSLVTKKTWDKTLPRKVNIFMWRLKLDRLPHRLNLSSRGIEIPKISCPFLQR